MIELEADGDSVLVPVKVVPGASRTRLMGEWDGRLKVGVAAAPEKGRANEALQAFIAKVCGVRKGAVSVVAGPTSPTKTLRIAGVTVQGARTALGLD